MSNKDIELSRLSIPDRLKNEVAILGATNDEILHIRNSFSEKDWQFNDNFADLKKFCLFIGYPRSGHSIIGSLLDAHPEMIIAHELDVLKFLSAGFSMEQIYVLLLENSRIFTEHGRFWGKYSYRVDGQWQGKHDGLKVIGDKKGGNTSYHLGNNPALLQKLFSVAEQEVRFIHTIRNPLDNIAGIARKNAGKVDWAISLYHRLCSANRMIIDTAGLSRVFELHHDDFIAEPKHHLARLCDFLGVKASDDYLEACAIIIYTKPYKRRDDIKWLPDAKDKVREIIDEFEFLSKYR